ncbi:MAG: hypothetical protein HOM11_02675 [Methylococcales bacterium]|nr:hypothetical protein [Methylococcales bacterium]MBT7444365.1 hypothetical protein [Methylococcales bacterium]
MLLRKAAQYINQSISNWLVKEEAPASIPLCDFERLQYEVRPADVILVEGRSRVSEVIKLITQSSWTHAALYIGRLYDISDPALRQLVQESYLGDPNDQLLVEAQLGIGTVVVPITKYEGEHLRICRPQALSPVDAHKVSKFCIQRLGMDYDVRHILDLARFLFPWTILPRRWRSSLFQHNAGAPTRTVCSTLLADAFTKVKYPILPFIERSEQGDVRFYKRNTRLFSPKDFDYSPYFDIIKYPYIGLDDLSMYRNLPWSDIDIVYNDDKDHLHRSLDEYDKEKQAEKQRSALYFNEGGPSNFLQHCEHFLKNNTPVLNTKERR